MTDYYKIVINNKYSNPKEILIITNCAYYSSSSFLY